MSDKKGTIVPPREERGRLRREGAEQEKGETRQGEKPGANGWEERLADIVDFLPDATFAINRQGHVIAWNRAIEGMTGICAKDMIGKGNYEYAVPFYGERRPLLVDLALSGNVEVADQYLFTHREGDVLISETDAPMVRGFSKHLWAKAKLLYDSRGEVFGAIESIRDVTDRTMAEEALRRSEEKFSIAFQANSALMAITTIEEGRFLDVNEAFLGTLGYARNEIIGKTAIELGIFEPADRSELMREFRKCSVVRNLKLPVRTKAGNVRTGLFNADKIRTGDGEYLLTVMNDVSDRLEAEREKERLREQLQLAQRMEAIGTLAGGIAHDFNNIIGAIAGYAEMTMSRLQEGDKIHAYLRNIHLASQKAKDLVCQILAFSRQTKLEFRPLSVWQIVRDTLYEYRSAIPERIEVRLENSADRDVVKGDAAQLHRALFNLLENAVQSMRESGGVLGVVLDARNGGKDAADPPQGPGCLPPGRYLDLSVSDTGAGIDRENMDRIFDPFFTTRNPSRGTGMGLAVVYGIVKSHGGIVTVDSSPGRGTAFHVYLPLIETPCSGEESKL